MLAVGGLAAEGGAGVQHLLDHGLLGSGFQADVDEAGAGDLQAVDPGLEGRATLQRLDQGLSQLARVLLQGARQLHRGRAGKVTVTGLLGGLESGGQIGAGAQFLDGLAQGGEQILLGLNHAAILRGSV